MHPDYGTLHNGRRFGQKASSRWAMWFWSVVRWQRRSLWWHV